MIKTSNFINGIQKLIANNKLGEAFDILNEIKNQFSNQVNNSIIINTRRYNSNLLNKTNSVLKDSEINIEDNKIVQSLLEGILKLVEKENLRNIYFNPDEKLKIYFKIEKTRKDKFENRKFWLIYLILFFTTTIVGITYSTKFYKNKDNLSIELVEEKIKNFTFDKNSQTNKDEARRILIHLGIGKDDIEYYPGYLIGKIDKINEIAIWIGTYGKINTYGIRYGKSDRKYFGSNETYFEIKKE